MNFTCNECNDSGSRDKLGTYLDCNACGTAATRRDLNDFVKSLGPTHPEDVALAIHHRALAMAPKQEAPHGMAFIGMVGSEQFKYVLEQLATGQPNPKERRRLVREVRDAIKLCAASQIKESAETLSVRDWIKVEDRLPEPYEEVRILFDGVPRIARLNHARAYFQLASFIDCKGQYIASFDKVYGWMPLALAPGKESPIAAPSAANGALTDERAAFESDTLDLYPSAKFNRFPSGTYTDSSIETQWGAWQRRSKFAADGTDAALIDALEKAEKKFLELEHMLGGGDDEVSVEVEILTIRAALSGAKGN